MHSPKNLAAITLAALIACGGSSNGGTATMSVHLVDGPSPSYLAIHLDVQTVEIQGSRGWIILGSPRRVIDLLSLTGGVAETLADTTPLPAGHYDQLRLVLGPDNSVTLADGTTHALKVPSGMQSGVKLVVSFDVAAGTTRDVFVDFDAHRSVFLHEAGHAGKYLLRPVIFAVDRLMTGSISGILTDDASTPLPLPGVTVTAQTVTSGVPSVVRTVTTGLDGKYTLDLLPLGATYHVVAQPLVGERAYLARASGGIALTPTAPTPSRDLRFMATTDLGSLGGTISPPPGADESDVVSLLQALDVGELVPQQLVVRTGVGSFDGVAELYGFTPVPAGPYAVVVTRRGEDAAGFPSFAIGAPEPATVTTAGTVLDLSAP